MSLKSRVRGGLVAAVMLLPALGTLSAQSSEPPEAVVEDRSGGVNPGTIISVPTPDGQRYDVRNYEIPELAGSRQAIGSQLVNGELPRPLAYYSSRVGHVYQRITIYQSGLVVTVMEGAGGKLHKKVIIPEDALEKYREHFSFARLSRVPTDSHTTWVTEDKSTIRIYDSTGEFVERHFNPSVVLSGELERARIALEDLLRAMAEDRESTHPLAGYKAKVGDKLIADDQRMYRIVRLINQGTIAELECTREPTKMYVAADELHHLFIGLRRGDE